MRQLLPALLLVLSVNCARASAGPSLPVDSPFVGLNQRDTICFTVGEILTVNDSLWSGVDHRAKRVIMARLIAEYSTELKATQKREAIEKQRADLASGNVAELVTAADQAGKDADFWKTKARRRGWVGWGLGLLTAFLGYIGVQELGK